MATSITASNSSAPFNSLLLTDANYVTSASYTSANSSVNFNDAYPYPTVQNTLLYVWSAPTAGGLSVYVQESSDNSTWSNVSAFNQPVISASSATSVQLNYGTPTAKQYLRISASQTAGGTGTYGLSVLM